MTPSAPDRSLVAPREPGRVWILEDSPLEAEMARRALAPGHAVEIFADGSELLERVANGEAPEVLILDWQLPGLNGLEVCRSLRNVRDEMSLPILMLTVQGRKSDIVEGLAAGANDYLGKPYDVAELLARVGRLVRTSRQNAVQLRRARHLALAADVGVILTRRRDVAQLAEGCVAAVARHLAAPLAAVWMLENDELVLVGAAGASAGGVPGRVAIRQGYLGDLAAHTMREVILDLPPAHPVRAEPWGRVGRALVAAPLVVGERTIGALVVLTPAPLHGEEADAIGSLADIVAIGLARATGESERAALLRREQRARAEAEAANRSKDEFLALVSHELRTPLNAISGWVHLLRTGAMPPVETDRALQTIERNAKAQAQLIEDLLDVSRIISGKFRLSVQPLDLAEVVDGALATVRPAAQAKDVAIRATVPPDLGRVVGDADRLKQVVCNLLTNAVKFTPSGGQIEVRVRTTSDGAAVAIDVTDTGQGIKPDFLPHVFERFRQADQTIARSQGGLGLGLAIVRSLVELHGGQVNAFSEGEGRGATFTVQLPRPAPRDGDSAAPTSSARPAPDYPSLRGIGALVVDDDDDARDLLAHVLHQAGAEVYTASSAAAAFAILVERRPDIMISDVGMPGEDGLSLVRRVRALSRDRGGDTPAVALTAYTRSEDRTKVVSAGFDVHVPKPIDPSELLAVVVNLAQRRHDHPPR